MAEYAAACYTDLPHPGALMFTLMSNDLSQDLLVKHSKWTDLHVEIMSEDFIFGSGLGSNVGIENKQCRRTNELLLTAKRKRIRSGCIPKANRRACFGGIIINLDEQLLPLRKIQRCHQHFWVCRAELFLPVLGQDIPFWLQFLTDTTPESRIMHGHQNGEVVVPRGILGEFHSTGIVKIDGCRLCSDREVFLINAALRSSCDELEESE